MSEEINFSLTQSTSLSDHTADKYTNACSDYVMYRKMARRCKEIIEREIDCCTALKINDYSIYKQRKEKYTHQSDEILNRAGHLLLLEYWFAHNKMNDVEFLTFVLKTNPRKK